MSELNAYVSGPYNVKHSCVIFMDRTGQNVLDTLNLIFLLCIQKKKPFCSKYFSHSLSNMQLYFREPYSIYSYCNKMPDIFICQRKDCELSDQNSSLFEKHSAGSS